MVCPGSFKICLNIFKTNFKVDFLHVYMIAAQQRIKNRPEESVSE